MEGYCREGQDYQSCNAIEEEEEEVTPGLFYIFAVE